MSKFKRFQKTLPELRALGAKIPRVFSKDNPLTVDIELLLEQYFGIQIDTVPLRIDHGIEAFVSISGNKVYVDTSLADSDWQENRYRFTLAEELAHVILHKPIYSEVACVSDWVKVWNEIPDEILRLLDNNAKELAGIILMPEDVFWKRAIELRNFFVKDLGIKGVPSDEQKSQIAMQIRKKLLDDFKVNEEPCRIRLGRIEKWQKKGFFEC